jgi:hypothetical protein
VRTNCPGNAEQTRAHQTHKHVHTHQCTRDDVVEHGPAQRDVGTGQRDTGDLIATTVRMILTRSDVIPQAHPTHTIPDAGLWRVAIAPAPSYVRACATTVTHANTQTPVVTLKHKHTCAHTHVYKLATTSMNAGAPVVAVHGDSERVTLCA